MNNFFGSHISLSDQNELVLAIKSYLNSGSLSLILGSGASIGLGLPKWEDLVNNVLETAGIDEQVNSETPKDVLKKHIEDAKRKLNSNYLNVVRDCLYSKVNFDYSIADKELLIPLTSLCSGSRRGRVSNVLTYNFDSVLEWYLTLNGLKTNIVDPRYLLDSYCDVEILHFHGYLPHETIFDVEHLSKASKNIVFSKKEFEDRMLNLDFWDAKRRNILQNKVFLSVGVSPDTLSDDIAPILRNIKTTYYENNNLIRNSPFGFALIGYESKDDIKKAISESKNTFESLKEDGIVTIPLVYSEHQIESFLFAILQEAIKD